MFIVTLENAGNKFWMRGTTWAFHSDRADVFSTEDEAKNALAQAAKFMAKRMAKKAVIEAI